MMEKGSLKSEVSHKYSSQKTKFLTKNNIMSVCNELVDGLRELSCLHVLPMTE